MKILAIDPGSEASGVVLFDAARWAIDWAAQEPNAAILARLRDWEAPADGVALVVEDIEHQGRMVGLSTFETCVWIGRFLEAWEAFGRRAGARLRRGDIKVELCGGHSYTDPETGRLRKVGQAEIRRALLGRFQALGGGATPQVGTAKQPGPLHGISGDGGHKWSALAVAVAWWAIHGKTATASEQHLPDPATFLDRKRYANYLGLGEDGER